MMKLSNFLINVGQPQAAFDRRNANNRISANLLAGALFIALSAVSPASAQNTEETNIPTTGDESIATQERAAALLDEAKRLRDEANQRFTQEETLCWQKILVNDCLDSANNRRVDGIKAARALEQQGRDMERELRRQEVAEKQIRQAEEIRMHEADKSEQARQASEEKANAEAEAARRQAEHESKIAEKRGQARAEQAETAKKQEEKEQKRREVESKAAERAKKAEEQRAEHARKMQERAERNAAKQAPQGSP